MREFDYIAEYAVNPDKATSHLYNIYRSQFTSYIGHIYSALSEDDVEDIYVDSVMVVWEKVGRGVLTRENMTSGLGTYLIGVGKLKAIHILSERKEVIEESLDDENAKEIVDESDNQLRREVREILNMLDKKCRQLLDEFYVYGYTMDEIAKRMKMANANTAKAQKYNCMKRFEELYNRLYGKSSGTDLPVDENRALTSAMNTNLQEEIIWELKAQQMRGKLESARRWRKRTSFIWIASMAACLVALITVGVWKISINTGMETPSVAVTGTAKPESGVLAYQPTDADILKCQTLACAALDEYEIGEYRGDYDITRLKRFSDMVKVGTELSAAQDSLLNFATEINARTYADDLEGYYYQVTDSELLEDIEYLQALCTMKQGHVLDARRQLRSIRDSGGLYAMDAEKLLDEW